MLKLPPCSIAGVFVICVQVFMKETRASVLLVRIAKKMRKETGNPRYRARVEDESASLRTLIYISCTRPVCECSSRGSGLVGSADVGLLYRLADHGAGDHELHGECPQLASHFSILRTDCTDGWLQLWIGFVWGILYVMIECVSSPGSPATTIFDRSFSPINSPADPYSSPRRSIGPVFQTLHHFNSGQVGSVFITITCVPPPAVPSFRG